MKRFRQTMIILSLLVAASSLQARTIYVKNDANGAYNGSSWENAFIDLQSAINKANKGDEIWVAAGTYKPTQAPKGAIASPSLGKRDQTFFLKDGVKIYGGFNGTETILAEREVCANATVLCGDLDGNDDFDTTTNSYNNNTGDDNVYHVVVATNIHNLDTVLDGFTITGGNADNNTSYIKINGAKVFRNHGAGMYILNTSVTLKNIIIKNNVANSFGGGMYNKKSSPNLSKIVFSNNAASNGGAMRNHTNSYPVIENAIFHANTAIRGGAIDNVGYSAPKITGATFYLNKASKGGAVFNRNNSSPTICNAIFWANAQNNNTEVAGADLRNSNNSSTTLNYSLTQSYHGNTGCIKTQDPLFINPSNLTGADGKWMTSDDGLRLSCESPAINVDSNNSCALGSEDIAGNTRIQGGTADFGAYESSKSPRPLARDIAGLTLPTAEGLYSSERIIQDGDWTHYCTCNNELLLSVENGTLSEIPVTGVSINIEDPLATAYRYDTGFVSSPGEAVMMHRTWDVADNVKLGATNTGIRFYFTDAEYQALQKEMEFPVADIADLVNYTTNDCSTHADVADLEPTDVILLTVGSSPTVINWVLGNIYTNDNFAEFLIDSTFCGGGGIGTAFRDLNIVATPVELVSFTATEIDNKGFLAWETASELNNKGFNVQHSQDGINFETIGFVDGVGTTTETQNYTFVHNAPFVGANYYRLIQEDFDGTTDKSEIKYFKIEGDFGFSVSPNPATEADRIRLNFDTGYKGLIKIDISSLDGRMVYQTEQTIEQRINVFNIDINDMSEGLYIVRVTFGNNSRTLRLVR